MRAPAGVCRCCISEGRRRWAGHAWKLSPPWSWGVMMPPSYARQSVMYWLLCHVSSFALYVPRSVASFSTVATLSITQRFRPSCCTQSRPAIAQCRVRGSESAKEGEQYQQLYTSTPSVSSWPFTATHVKVPVDSAMLPRVQDMREQLDTQVLTAH